MRNVNFIQDKKGKEPIVMLTAYSAPTAMACEENGVDIILVGDSLAMTFLGRPSTIPISVDEMLLFVSAVRQGAQESFVVADMPFGSYGVLAEESVKNAIRFLQQGRANAVKLEGANPKIIDDVKAMRDIGIEVMGHIGLTPQSLVNRSGFKVQGRDDASQDALLEEAVRLQEAGCFSLVLECVPEQLGRRISEQLAIPVIGIGAGRYTDGQVLVFDDVVGAFDKFRPKFVKSYSDVWQAYNSAVSQYVEEVRQGNFPKEENIYE